MKFLGSLDAYRTKPDIYTRLGLDPARYTVRREEKPRKKGQKLKIIYWYIRERDSARV